MIAITCIRPGLPETGALLALRISQFFRSTWKAGETAMKIVWADSHELHCIALAHYLELNAEELGMASIKVVPVFTFARAIDELTRDPPPDFVFLDLDLDDAPRGARTLEQLQAHNRHNVPVAAWMTHGHIDDQAVETIRTCLGDHAAQGILVGRNDHRHTLNGLRRILAGDLWIPDAVLRRLTCTRLDERMRNPHGLSPREWEVARRIGRGLSGKEIARELDISPGHVRQVSCAIYDKLGVRNRTEAAIRVNELAEKEVEKCAG
jgi:two-component system nitrate/nitrite response regulator NarL